MKKWAMLFTFMLGLATLWSACGNQPQIIVTENNLELGDVVNGEVIAREIGVQNNGEVDLIIEAVTTSCGCTQATIEPTTIPPGSNGMLYIEFDSGAHGPELTGQLIRQVFVATNDPQQPETVVNLSANILPPDDP
jgi:hypothetical protein